METKTAAHWLNRACDYELQNELKKAEMALNAAIKYDDKEHHSNPKTASLPRSE